MKIILISYIAGFLTSLIYDVSLYYAFSIGKEKRVIMWIIDLIAWPVTLPLSLILSLRMMRNVIHINPLTGKVVKYKEAENANHRND